MPTTIQDIKLTVRNLLRTSWDNSTLPVALDDVDIHTGWYDDGKGFPQVSVSNDEEGASNGGETGYSAIAADGSGGIQSRSGTVLVTVWGGSRDDYDSRGLEELQTETMADVVEEIVGANQSPGNLTSLAVGQRTKLVDDDADPVEHAVQFQLRYTWTKTP